MKKSVSVVLLFRWLSARLMLALLLVSGAASIGIDRAFGADEAADDPNPAATRTVDVVVTYVTGQDVFLDRGRLAGLRVGDIVRFPERGANVEAEIVTVSSASARAEFAIDLEPIPTGTRGRVDVPASRPRPSDRATPGAAKPTPGQPDHPPWSRDIEPRDDDEPLLAPAFGILPADRPVDFRGRVFLGWNGRWDRAGDRDVRDYQTRLGADLRWDNLFGIGGRFEVDAEVRRRDLDLDGANEDATTRTRLERFSYLWGWDSAAPVRVEVGRFVSDDLPELGVIDGADVMARTGLGDFGVIAGGYPEPSFDRGTGDSATVAVYHRVRAGTQRRFSFVSAYQHSWHLGDNDRDLFLGRLEWNPNAEWSLYSNAWVDYYTSDDRLKSSGLELTEVFGTVQYRPSRAHSFRVSASQSRWPELRRDEFATASETLAETVRRSRRRQARLSTRHRLATHLRVDTRTRVWSDQDDDGYGAEVSLRTPNWPSPGWELLAAVSYRENPAGDTPGLRAGITHAGRSHTFQLLYLHSEQNYDALSIGEQSITSQRAIVLFDWLAGEHWTWSSQIEAAFGDDEDSTGANVYLQYRF